MIHTHKLFLVFFLIISSAVFADNLDAIQIALDLCADSKTQDECFIYSKSLLNKYENYKGIQDLLKELMAQCLVSFKYIREANENANEVLKFSSNPLNIGCAWIQKGRYAYYQEEYNEALMNYVIALKALEKAPDTAGNGNISFRKFYQFICHLEKKFAYEGLGEKQKAEEEQVLVDSFMHSLDKKS